MNNQIEKTAAEIIQRNFDLEEVSSDENPFERIRSLLIDKLDFLLNHDFEKLLWMLYRIDVSEEKAKQALAMQSEKKSCEILADLIIERQIEKAKTRMQYKSDHGDL